MQRIQFPYHLLLIIRNAHSCVQIANESHLAALRLHFLAILLLPPFLFLYHGTSPFGGRVHELSRLQRLLILGRVCQR